MTSRRMAAALAWVGDAMWAAAVPLAYVGGRSGAPWLLLIVLVPVAVARWLSERSAGQSMVAARRAADEARGHADRARQAADG